MNSLEKLEKKYKELGKEIERLKTEKENEIWKPKDGERYWYINNSGVELTPVWHGDIVDKSRYALGNVFRTQEEAEFYKEQLKVEAALKRFARPFKNDSENYTLRYWQDEDVVEIICFELSQCGNIYFPSREIAKKAIDIVGEDRIKMYYFGIIE